MTLNSNNLQELCDNLLKDCESYIKQGLVVNIETFRYSHSILFKRAPSLYNMIIESIKTNNKETLSRFLPTMIKVLDQLERGVLTKNDADKLIGEFFAKEFIPQYNPNEH